MDKPKRVRRVTVRTERTYVFRSRGGVRVGWCAGCGAEVGLASVDGAAREAGVSELAIYKLVEEHALHFKAAEAPSESGLAEEFTAGDDWLTQTGLQRLNGEAGRQ
ncbi:MAG: hypothetical protein LC795_19950 [Acidobacteria bacterium]|nr:hypothetical protein [Acidobacteriota bacterium]MCA1621500.1 hypothetical protein [Acidobacteriota bacterium]